VRVAGPEDVVGIRRLLESTGSPAHAAEVEAALGDGRHVVVIAEHGADGGVGLGVMRLVDAPTGADRPRAEVRLLAVHASWRGRGVGIELLEGLRREAVARGVTEVRISTRARRPSP